TGPPEAAGQPATVAGLRTAESRATAAPSALAEPEPPAQAAAGAVTVESMTGLWPAVVDLVRSENARLAAVIEQARPVEIEGDEMTVAFGLSFFKKQAERPADRMVLGEALNALTGKRWR